MSDLKPCDGWLEALQRCDIRKPLHLSPCPFCGGEAKVQEYSDGLFFITCAPCTIFTRYDTDEDELIAIWNNRVEEN